MFIQIQGTNFRWLTMEEKQRCPWQFKIPEYLPYHDHEWGTPNHDDKAHFEFLVMENFQAGLSFSMIFRKRENYRKAFADFDPAKVSLSQVADMLAYPVIAADWLRVQCTTLQPYDVRRDVIRIKTSSHRHVPFLNYYCEVS